MLRPAGRSIRSARSLLRAVACGICFGLAGLVWSMPRFRVHRLRRAATCPTCTSHMRVRNVTVFVAAALLLAGAAARTFDSVSRRSSAIVTSPRTGKCNPSRILRSRRLSHEALPEIFLVAPISGVGVLAGRVMGMESCSGPPLLVMFWPPPRTSGGGSVLGDVFVAWMPREKHGPAP